MKGILIIEDEKDIVNLLSYHFRQAGYNVSTALNGFEGLQKAKKEKPSIIILDLMLPELDGEDVCRALKADPLTKSIPILMLTAKSEEVDRIIGFELGADDYVTKPFSPRELVLRVKAILRRRESTLESQRIIEIEDLLIDLDRHQVFLQKEPVYLTSTEFKLLFELVSNRGRVQTREMLLNKVWGYTYEGYARTVDTHIRRLRDKLRDKGDWIETIRGVGYRFRE